ncbi:MAG: transposase [Bacteroidia bacterium]|nr:transposase [Bacteroidia bacterium]
MEVRDNQVILTITEYESMLSTINTMKTEIEMLKAEIRLLKCHPQKPNIKPSNLEDPSKKGASQNAEKRAGSAKREKTKTLPKELEGCHFGTELRKFILYQYYHCHVTQPLLYEQLDEMGVDISEGELNNLIIENKEIFHQEKEAILTKGLAVSSFIQTDDTGARHNGKNGYCTVICNDLFTYFKSGENKSRINFLELLRTPQHEDYLINPDALTYMEQQGLPDKYKRLIAGLTPQVYSNKSLFEKQISDLGITAEHAIKVITEGALIGSLIEHGINKEMAILSDDAGQFNVFIHGLCWVHSERNIQKVHCFTDEQSALLELKLDDFWKLYQELKCYKKNNTPYTKEELTQAFDKLCTEKTGFLSLDKALEKVEKTNKNYFWF